MNRRRLLGINDSSVESGIIEDDLLFWCDGLNGMNGDKWYAAKTSQALDGFYLKKAGNVNTLSNSWEIPYNSTYPQGGIISESNPMVGLSSNAMTIIVVASDLKYPIYNRDAGIVLFTRYQVDYGKRQAILRQASTTKIGTRGYDSGEWYCNSITPPSSIDTHILFYSSNGTTAKLVSEIDGITINESGHKILKKDISYNDIFLIIGAYDYWPFYNNGNSPGTSVSRSQNNWCDWPGKYHSVLMYDRALSDDEISQTSTFLKSRYGLI